jgi:hypothetical protein
MSIMTDGSQFEVIDVQHISDVAPVSKLFHDVLAQERAIQVKSVHLSSLEMFISCMHLRSPSKGRVRVICSLLVTPTRVVASAHAKKIQRFPHSMSMR